MHELDRDSAVRDRVQRFIDATHPAHAEQAQEAVFLCDRLSDLGDGLNALAHRGGYPFNILSADFMAFNAESVKDPQAALKISAQACGAGGSLDRTGRSLI